jgi:methyl-accepting chemotaxis protein
MEELEVKEISTDELIDIGVITNRFINNLEDLRGFVHNLAPFAKAYDDKAKEVYEGVTSILRNVPQIPGQEKAMEVDEEKVEGAAKGIRH